MLRIKANRLIRELSKDDVCVAMNISRPTLTAWEEGQVIPRADKLFALAKYYGCSADGLLDEAEEVK